MNEKRTTYLLETTYIDEGLPLRQALNVACSALAPWAERYEARLIAPRERGIPTTRRATLPSSLTDRRARLTEILDWLDTNSVVEGVFALRLWEADQQRPFFEYPDTHDAWALWLTPEQWKALHDACQAASLPDDLFFDADAIVCVSAPGHSLLARLARRLGFRKCYTPRAWQRRHASS